MKTYLKIIFLSALLGSCFWANAQDAAQSLSADWQPLFKTVNGTPNYNIFFSEEGALEDAEKIFRFKGDSLEVFYDWDQSKRPPRGLVTTKEKYESYDLKLEFKWGERRFIPRMDLKKDAGILFHVVNPQSIWPSSLECQIQETDCGDLWIIDGATCQVLKDGEIHEVPLKNKFGTFAKWQLNEKEGWNEVKIEVRKASAKYYINGLLVNEIVNARFSDQPLEKGFIGLQAEYAELTYRNVLIRGVGE